MFVQYLPLDCLHLETTCYFQHASSESEYSQFQVPGGSYSQMSAAVPGTISTAAGSAVGRCTAWCRSVTRWFPVTQPRLYREVPVP